MGKPFNIDELRRGGERAIERLEERIGKRAGPLLQLSAPHDSDVIRSLAQAAWSWKGSTDNGASTGLYTWREDFQRDWSQRAASDAQAVRASLHKMVAAMPQSFVLSIIKRLESQGSSLEQMNIVLSAIDDEVESIETAARNTYQGWVVNHGGNKRTPAAYLRLSLDDVLREHVGPRLRRAHIIATVEVAISIIDQEELGSETKRVNSFLRERGR